MIGKGWTNHEILIAAEMRKLGHTYQEIGERLGRKHGSIKSVLIRNRLVPTVKEAALQRETTKKLLGHIHIQRPGAKNVVSSLDVPGYVIAERDRRADEPRTLSMVMFGDPPFSQSALARPPRGGQSNAEKA